MCIRKTHNLLGPWLWSLELVITEGAQGRYSGETGDRSSAPRGCVGELPSGAAGLPGHWSTRPQCQTLVYQSKSGLLIEGELLIIDMKLLVFLPSESGANSEECLILWGRSKVGDWGPRGFDLQEPIKHHPISFSPISFSCSLPSGYLSLIWPPIPFCSVPCFLLQWLVSNSHTPNAPEFLAIHQHVPFYRAVKSEQLLNAYSVLGPLLNTWHKWFIYSNP